MRKGYSLLLVVIALGVLAIGILSIVSLLPTEERLVRRTVFNARSATVAEREFNRIRTLYGTAADPWPPAELEGREGSDLRWKAAIRNEGELYRVTLNVHIKTKGREESESFETSFIRR
ncbi:MAG TPA: hypothetical protein PKN80_04080 [bacterium]|nr:hypothetical protein [bacterium]HNS48950.1 hypothetical protein [bacterium]